jgi:uncharacterized protein
MADEGASISVNFGRSMPLFPLDQVHLLPQQIRPLHIFEPRYRQMVERVLDGAGQFALAVYEGDAWKLQHHGRPPIKPAVCVAQIVEHEKLPDGRYNVMAQGVCRARVVREIKPDDSRLYRAAMLEPVGLEAPDPIEMSEVRERLQEMLLVGPLQQLRAGRPLAECLQNDSFPTAAILELVSFTIVSDPKLRYRLLAEGDAQFRSKLILDELDHLRRLVQQGAAQRPDQWPKGCSWN